MEVVMFVRVLTGVLKTAGEVEVAETVLKTAVLLKTAKLLPQLLQVMFFIVEI